jgi:hypothetical protein
MGIYSIAVTAANLLRAIRASLRSLGCSFQPSPLGSGMSSAKRGFDAPESTILCCARGVRIRGRYILLTAHKETGEETCVVS